MNVSLTPELEKLVEEKVKSGMFNSASEVVRASLRLLKEQDDLREMRLEELRREIQIGIDDIENGRYTTYDTAEELVADIKARGRALMKERQKENEK